MAEYIKREDAIQTAKAFAWGDNSLIVERMQKIPAADVVKRKKGKWETAYLDHEAFGVRPTVWYCSECHQITTFRTFFCPNCGADLREKS